MSAKKRTAGQIWQDTWSQELLAITVSILAYLAILVLFAVYDGKPDFQWHGLTLNAAVSALSTTSRLLLLIVVSSCIGQLRWNAFSLRQTPISHMDTWDNASRGALGCFDLLWKTRSLSISAIGAWLTILAVAFEPSIQQALRFTGSFNIMPSDDKLVAEIQSARSWDGGRIEGPSAQVTANGNGALVQFSATTLDFSVLSAMYNGLAATPAQISQQAPFTCSTGHCEWKPYLSLAVCSACYDVRDEIKTVQASARDQMHSFNCYWTDYDSPVANYTGPIFMLPNNLTDMECTRLFRSSINHHKDRFTMVSSPQSNLTTVSQITAKECGIYFCVKSYTSKITNGTLNEEAKEVSSTMDPSSFTVVPNNTVPYSGPEPPDVLYELGSYVPRRDIRILPPTADAAMFDSRNFTISQNGAGALVDQASIMFNASNIGLGLQLGISIGGGGRRTAQLGDVFEPASVQTLYRSTNIGQTFANLADSLTNDMRRHAITTQTQLGQVGLPVTLVRIRWGWVAFSAVVVVTGVAFLLICVLLTRKVVIPLWKTNSLVTLFHQLRPWPCIPASDKLSAYEMTKLSEDWSGKLGDDHTLELTTIPKTGKNEKPKQSTQESKPTSTQETSLLRTPQSNHTIQQRREEV